MSRAAAPDAKLLQQFCLTNPDLVSNSRFSTVWRAEHETGQLVALKVYHAGDARGERPGFGLQAAWNGNGAARLIDRSDDAIVVEWLSGPSLGDMIRAGQDDSANQILVNVAKRLHARPVAPSPELSRLEAWCGSLFTASFAPSCPAATRNDFADCRAIAMALLMTPPEEVALHGDLHHDNVRLGERGYCAFDAKGIVGERAFELACAFRSPAPVPERMRTPAHVRTKAALWSAQFGVAQERLLGWAAVICALNIAWRAAGPLEHDDEFALLSVLIEASGAAG